MSKKSMENCIRYGKLFWYNYLCEMMKTTAATQHNKQIAIWLLIGVGMIMIQVLLGGITRLTESGLSITEWKPITGTLPPLNDAAWQIEFDKYRNTDQFKFVHQHFSLREFKFIFFWEWFHRVWARLMGMVFLIGFVYFIVRKKFSKKMVMPMILLFILGALQGAIGWFMVKSGLVPEKYFVGHIELTTHFISALILLSYTLWFSLQLLPSMGTKVYDSKRFNLLLCILLLLLLQLVFGGFMAGMHAAASAPTWPTINGDFAPAQMNELSPWINNFIHNKLMVHFIHRTLGYLLFILIFVFFFQSKKLVQNNIFNTLRMALVVLVSMQVVLGILTLLNATTKNTFIILGVAHQFTAMLLVTCLVSLMFMIRRKQPTLA